MNKVADTYRKSLLFIYLFTCLFDFHFDVYIYIFFLFRMSDNLKGCFWISDQDINYLKFEVIFSKVRNASCLVVFGSVEKLLTFENKTTK